MIRTHPGEMREPPKRMETPSDPLQYSSNEYPNTAVGTTNGMSASVSSMLIHGPFLRAMSQAIGIPVTRSIIDTSIAIVKEF